MYGRSACKHYWIVTIVNEPKRDAITEVTVLKGLVYKQSCYQMIAYKVEGSYSVNTLLVT